MLCTAEIFTVMDPYLLTSGQVVDVPIEGASLDSAAETLLRLVLEKDRPVGVMGVSLGAIIAMAAAAQNPTAFDAVVLISTNPQAPRPEQFDAWSLMVSRVADGEFPELADELVPALFAPKRATARLLQVGRSMAGQLGQQALLKQLQVQRSRRDLRPELLRINAPTLVIAGSADQLCGRQPHQDITAAIPNAQLHILEGFGHLMTLEDPATTAGLINQWTTRSNS